MDRRKGLTGAIIAMVLGVVIFVASLVVGRIAGSRAEARMLTGGRR